jgi:hypothetical protein
MAKQRRNQDTHERPRKPSRPKHSSMGDDRPSGSEPGSVTEREERSPDREGDERGQTGTPRRTQDE